MVEIEKRLKSLKSYPFSVSLTLYQSYLLQKKIAKSLISCSGMEL